MIDGRIIIVSGEGTQGKVEEYSGKKTERAIRNRLAQERQGGDRWANAYIYSHSNDGGDVFYNFDEPSEQRHF